MAKYKDRTELGPKEVEQLACPLCGWVRGKNRYGVDQDGKPREVRFDKIDLDKALIWRVLRLGGRYPMSKRGIMEVVKGRTLAELDSNVKKQIATQCRRILNIIEKSE